MILRALVVAYLLYGSVFAVAVAWPRLGWAGGAGVFLLAAVTFAACVRGAVFRGPGYLLMVGLAGGLGLHAVAPYTGFSALFVIAFAAPYRLPVRWAAALVAADIAGITLVSLAVRVPVPALIGFTIGTVYASILAYLLRQITLSRELAGLRVREAAQAERTHLAREIHDILAHAQSAQIVHLEGARLLLERGDVQAGLDRVNRAVRLARSGLEETKRAVDALRDEDIHLPERLRRLAVEHRSAGGGPCAVVIGGELGDLPAGARLAVVRTAQESLTNVRKHAPGAAVTVVLRCSGGWCELEVRVEATRRIRAAHPGIQVVVLTTYSDDESVFAALGAGACGYLTKDTDAETLARAIAIVSGGQAYFDPDVQRRLAREVARRGRRSGDLPDGLTPREVEVLRLIAAGRSNAEIAGVLFISAATVKTHINNLFAKAGLRDRAQAVAYAYRHGLA
ncbi:helix-turn-helix transcriptional regulator [Nonomuraea typhae]|uniref:helix-turn-helix transcriptional regulator n=1 Tax=Nonomuraea typhae TaxID=2603600 RepID=UPI0012FCD7F2|nr:response regulator transcription factor family protein [Nonomuraea typhae]